MAIQRLICSKAIARCRLSPRFVLPKVGGFGYKSVPLKEFQVASFPLSSMDAMPLESPPAGIASRLVSARNANCSTSVACGIYIVCWLQQAQAGFGTSLASQTSLAIVVLFAVGAAAAINVGLAKLQSSRTGFYPLGMLVMLHAFAAATVLFSNVLYAAGWSAIDRLAGATLPESTTAKILILGAGLSVSWLLPFTAVALWLLRPEPQRAAETNPLSRDRRLGVAAVAAAFSITVVSGLVGLNAVMWIALALGALGAATEALLLFRNRSLMQATAAESAGPALTAESTACSRPAQDTLAAGLSTSLVVVVVALACGSLFAFLNRIGGQLFFAAAWQSVIQWSSVVLVTVYSPRALQRTSYQPHHLLLLATVWSIAVLGAWPGLVRICLELNSGVSSIIFGGAARAFITSVCVFPVGLALGAVLAWRGAERMVNETESQSISSSYFEPCGLAVAFVGGWLATCWWGMSGIGVAGSVAGLSLLLAAVALADCFHRESWRSAWRPTIAFCWLFVLAGPLLAERYDPQLSAKLLFDTAVFVTHQREERTDILPYLDEGRCIATAESDHGTLTFWRYQGRQLQIRESGLPLSSVSCDTSICTQPSAESLQAIIPLVLHEGPARLLLLGVRSGAVLKTSITFPLESIVCVDSDQRLLDAVSEHVFSKVETNPLDDARVTIQTAEPLLKLRTSTDSADIIIASADHPGIATSASMVTTEFLTSAASALRGGGLFCQPLDYADFGPDALQLIVETWQSVFAEVAAIEIAPGKFLLIGTDSPEGVIRPGVVERLQRPNVRFVLAQMGWDWCTPLQLSVYTDKRLTTAFGESLRRICSVSDSRLTCFLPWEIMRWGNKYSAIMSKIGPHAQTLKYAVGDDALDPDVQSRLAELTSQRELIHEHPDEYWFYRRKVRERLTRSVPSEIMQVKSEEPFNQLRRVANRRLDYFKALGAAARQEAPDRATLHQVEAFAQPYDPLLSLFLHQEIAELASRDSETNFDIELRHRLHRIYFSAPTDQAVRNVVAAIELICQHPEAIPDEADRSDQLDALLQVLHDRWHNRGGTSPGSSKIVLNDIEKSLAVIDRAFEVLTALRSSRGYSSENWQSRRLALEKSLVRPLQAYRTTLLPHHAKSQVNAG
ncbi:MAG: hypothetical protein O3B13_11715 [Planctomycetota bacterium]|nr:hypothetical protein [Planctomycetota bacterium]